MDILFPLINTLLLLIIFFYQKNRNKVLTDRITQQEKLIEETKNVVSQQAVAITGQSNIVKSAMEYSRSFDISKLEDIIKREVVLEKNEEIDTIKREYQDKITAISKSGNTGFINKLVSAVIPPISQKVVAISLDIFTEPLLYFFMQFVGLSTEQKEAKILSLQNKTLREMAPGIIDGLEQELKRFKKQFPNK